MAPTTRSPGGRNAGVPAELRSASEDTGGTLTRQLAWLAYLPPVIEPDGFMAGDVLAPPPGDDMPAPPAGEDMPPSPPGAADMPAPAGQTGSWIRLPSGTESI